MIDKELLQCNAVDNGFEIVFERLENKMIRFQHVSGERIDVWYSTGTISFVNKCKYIKDLTTKDVEKIFIRINEKHI